MILYRYIIKELIFPFLVSLSIIIFYFIMQQAVLLLERIISKGLDPAVVLEVFIINLGWIIALAIPMAILTATLWTFGPICNKSNTRMMTQIKRIPWTNPKKPPASLSMPVRACGLSAFLKKKTKMYNSTLMPAKMAIKASTVLICSISGSAAVMRGASLSQYLRASRMAMIHPVMPKISFTIPRLPPIYINIRMMKKMTTSMGLIGFTLVDEG